MTQVTSRPGQLNEGIRVSVPDLLRNFTFKGFFQVQQSQSPKIQEIGKALVLPFEPGENPSNFVEKIDCLCGKTVDKFGKTRIKNKKY